MEIMTRKSFDIPEFMENQKFSGYCSTAQTYQFKLQYEDGETGTVTGTINGMILVNDETSNELIDVKMQLYPTWTTDGPKDIMTEVLVSSITEAQQVYIKFKPLYKAPKRQISPDTKTFVFRFSNTDLILTPGDFVKISYREEHSKLRKGEENRRGVFGYITDIADDVCKMVSISTFRGLFDMVEVEIPVKSIYAVFRYFVEVSEFVRKENKPGAEITDGVSEAAEDVPETSEPENSEEVASEE